MKKMVAFTLVVILFYSLSGCSANKVASIKNGTYMLRVDENDDFKPSIKISDGVFTFNYDLLSSYLNRGSYRIEGVNLILTTEDTKYEYYFEIKEDTMIFQEEKSFSVELTNEKLGVQLTDGDVFELVKSTGG